MKEAKRKYPFFGKMVISLMLILLILGLLPACSSPLPPAVTQPPPALAPATAAPAATPAPVTWDDTLAPLFQKECIACHGGSSGLSLDSYENALKGGRRGPAILPGDGEGSLLVHALRGSEPGLSRMPQGRQPWLEAQIALVAAWIDAGAPRTAGDVGKIAAAPTPIPPMPSPPTATPAPPTPAPIPPTAAPIETAAPAPSMTASPFPTATPAPTDTPVPGDAARGASAWPSLSCANCHGNAAQGGFGPKLAGTGLSLDAVLLRVRAGKGSMPAFSAEQISDQTVRDLYAWFRSLAQPTPTPITTLPYSLDNVNAYYLTVSEVKVRCDFAKDLPERFAPGDPDGQLAVLKQYATEAVNLANQALGQGQAAINDIPNATVQNTLRQSMDHLRRIVDLGNAALGSGSFNDAWPLAAEMVKISRLDSWPLAAQAVRETGSVGSVRVRVTDQAGRAIAGAFVTVLTAHLPAAGVADAQGRVTLRNIAALPGVQVKAYAANLVYHEVHVNIPRDGLVDVSIVLPEPNVRGQTPAVSGASLAPAAGAGNATVTFAVTATDPQGNLNLAEDQIFALSPTLGLAYILRDAGGDRWQSSYTLPGLARGTHPFYVFAVDHQCNTSNVLRINYTVQ